MNAQEIRGEILAGKFDGELDSFIQAIEFRKKDLARKTFHQLEIGDRVRISNANLRPRYLVGKTAIVRRKMQTNIVIDFESCQLPVSSRYLCGLRIPVEYVELVQ